jgi:dihydrofolate reductase
VTQTGTTDAPTTAPAGTAAPAALPGLGAIWAQSADGVIGRDGALPWSLPEDLARFRRLTDGCVVVMGRATWESLPDAYRPLPGRENVVLSRRGLDAPGATVVPDVAAALDVVGRRPAWVVGGGQVYAALLPYTSRAEVTDVDVLVGPGVRAPRLGEGWRLLGQDPADGGWHTSRTGLRYRFRTLERAG